MSNFRNTSSCNSSTEHHHHHHHHSCDSHPRGETYRDLAGFPRSSDHASGCTLYDTEVAPKIENGKFMLQLDYHGFEPRDIEVKMERDTLVIKGKRDGEPKNGVAQNREIVQQFTVPKCVRSDMLTCKLDSAGFLNVEAPVKQLPDERVRERYIPVYKSVRTY